MSPASLRCFKSVCRDMLGEDVRGAVLLLAALILMILTRSCCTSCCTKRCLSSMCSAFFEDPILVAMLFQLEETLWILMLTFLMLGASCRKFLMRSDLVAPVLIACSSASALPCCVQFLLAHGCRSGLLIP